MKGVIPHIFGKQDNCFRKAARDTVVGRAEMLAVMGLESNPALPGSNSVTMGR